MSKPLLFGGGRIHVGDGTTAEALVMREGRVAAIGRAVDLRRDASDAELVDLHGGLMVPGWYDAHVHFMWWSLQRSRLDLVEAATLQDALARIEHHCRSLPAGAWLIAYRFDKNRWGRWPTAAELDAVTRDHPAVIRTRDGHARWANSRALALAGIGAATADPPGGRIDRDAAGNATGILFEQANRLLDAVVPAPTADECVAAARRGQQEAWRAGIVGLEDLEDAAALAAFRRLQENGDLGLRIAMGIPYQSPADVDATVRESERQLASFTRNPAAADALRASAAAPRHDFETALANGTRTGDGDEWLRTGHLKIFTDGALGSQTAALDEPYEGIDDRGILRIEPDVLRRDVARAAAAGIAVAIHAIGDHAVHVALEAIAPTRSTAPQLRQKIEHLQLVRSADLSRFGSLGVIASMQPIHATSDRDLADRYWGPGRTGRAYPWRTLRQTGAVLAFGSDAPVEPIDPLLGIYAAVTRKRPTDEEPWHAEQSLDMDEALAGYSIGAAYALGVEREAGMLRTGMRADATVVDRDILQEGAESLLGTRVRATITGGVVRFEDGLG